MFTIREIASIIDPGRSLVLASNHLITRIITDTRDNGLNENCAFLAIKGNRYDGHSFVKEAVQKGIKCFIVSEKQEIERKDLQFFICNDTIEALQTIAVAHRKKFTIPVIGVTGSYGKTIVKEWLTDLLSTKYNTIKSPGSFNSQVGVPLSICQLASHHEIGVVEAGISKMGEMMKLEKIIKPSLGIFTNIGSAHQEGFYSIYLKAKEKIKLFVNCDAIVYCEDSDIINDTVLESLPLLKPELKLISWGKKASAMFMYDIKTENGDSFLEVYQNGIQVLKIRLNIQTGAYVENLMHSIVTAFYFGVDHQLLVEKVEHFNRISMRLELIRGENNSLIINDSYSANLETLAIALGQLSKQAPIQRKVLILSDFVEDSFTNTININKLVELLNQYSISFFVGIGKQFQAFNKQYSRLETELYSDAIDFIARFDKRKLSDSTVLIKGARMHQLERIAHHLQEKSHITTLEVNLEAMRYNFNHLKSLLPIETKVMVMVKAFSYGAGSFEVARLLENQGADYLAVAYLDEAIDLRNRGIKLPLMIMVSGEDFMDKILHYNLEPEVYSIEQLNKIMEWIKLNQHSSKVDIHISLDTGMNRLGFAMNEIDLLIEILLGHKANLNVVSIYSHFVASDEPLQNEFTKNQLFLFQSAAEKIVASLGYRPILHIANSEGIINHPDAHLDMVRFGLGFYGISSTIKLQSVLEFKTKIIQVREISQGESVGYGRAWIAEKSGKIGVIPVGYADGFHRGLGNGIGEVLIRGKRYKTAGRICMDLTMIDLQTDDISVGDEVVLFNGELTVDEISEKLDTIPYEIISTISARVKRIYIDN